MTAQLSTIAASNVQTLDNTGAAVRIAGNQLAEQLIAAERAIDAAVAAVATLTATMPTVTQQAKVGTHVMQESLMHVMETCQQLVKARTNILRTHKAMRAAQVDMGMGEVALGDMSYCNKAEFTSPEVAFRGLAAVA
ncbi:hypothetical protein [Sandarakinorhabdus sp. DWP1-3-1]|uniref:hypothetical protein n=1 Tax=Sandarakinorhabdus sp. DWP1-3-1 TaxID=2804627 RepID=UPI003CEB4A5B